MTSKHEHFEIEQWADFVRGHASPPLGRQMQEHLEQGCDSCGPIEALWRSVAEAGRREEAFQAPDSDVRCARTLYSAFPAPRQRRSLHLHFARLTSFFQPALEGVRGGGAAATHYVFDEGDLSLDVRLERGTGFGMASMVGQIVNPAAPESRYAGNAVSLQMGEQTVAKSTLNEYGEFHLEFMPWPELLLIVELDEQSFLFSRVPSGEEAA